MELDHLRRSWFEPDDEPEMEECSECKGSGRVPCTAGCDNGNKALGDGKYDYETECELCDGEGDLGQCLECEGSGDVPI